MSAGKAAHILHLFYQTFDDVRETSAMPGCNGHFPSPLNPQPLPEDQRRGEAMPLQTGNLFSVEGRRGGDERIDMLATGPRVNVERIVSMGHASPDGFWYDDPRAEWVVLLSGAAVLEFEEGATRLDMRAGDYVLIEPHCRHRVAWTHDEVQTVWLAVYYER